MDDAQFDAALIRSAMSQAEARGWSHVTVAGAARAAGLALDRARSRFPTRACILLGLGRAFDEAALAQTPGIEGSTASSRELLFDVLMRRFDALQRHRDGVRSLLRSLPFDPHACVLLMAETRNSMGWMAQSAGIDTTGLKGSARVAGLVAVWLVALRAWERDDSPDLSGTMAALDRALDRAESLGRMLQGRDRSRGDEAGGALDITDPSMGERFEPESPPT